MLTRENDETVKNRQRGSNNEEKREVERTEKEEDIGSKRESDRTSKRLY